MEKGMKFKLGQKVKLKLSDEKGEVTGVAKYTNDSDSFRVLYKSADGKQTQCWWSGDEIEAAGE